LRLQNVVAGYPLDLNWAVKKSTGDCIMLFLLHRSAAASAAIVVDDGDVKGTFAEVVSIG
jgi:hypothetical protein